MSVIADAAMLMYHGRNPLPDRELYQDYEWSLERKQAACGVYHSDEENEVEIFLKDGVPAARVNGTEGAFLPVQEYLGIFRKAEKDDYVKLYPDAEGKIFAVGFGGRMLPRVK